MSLNLWEAVHDADARSHPLFDIDPELVPSTPPSLQRVLLAAATLWCRTMTWPTVREIASTAAVSASTAIEAVGSSEELRALLVQAEFDTIVALAEGRRDEFESIDRTMEWAFTARARRLALIDRALVALPTIAILEKGGPSLASALAMMGCTTVTLEILRLEAEVA